jgi:hypothetical protein
MTSGIRRALPALVIAGAQIQASAFSFDGVSLHSDFREVAARYPHSTPQDQYVSLSPQDIHDHISEIEVSGTGRGRRVRIGFETRPDGQHPDYPTCAAIEAKLVPRFGRPQAIRRFYEEATARADRVWRSPTEELTLLCFKGARHRLLAEAVLITPR